MFQTVFPSIVRSSRLCTRIQYIQVPNIDSITTDNGKLIAGTFNNYFTSITENIKTTDRNAYIQNKNGPDTANNDTSSQYVKEMEKIKVYNISMETN